MTNAWALINNSSNFYNYDDEMLVGRSRFSLATRERERERKKGTGARNKHVILQPEEKKTKIKRNA